MKKLNLSSTPVDHLCEDNCGMSISSLGSPVVIKAGKLKPKLKTKALTVGKGKIGGESLESTLTEEGFEPWADILEIPAPKIAAAKAAPIREATQTSVEVVLDAPDGFYLIGVVTSGNEANPTFIFPEDEVRVSNTPHASAFSHQPDQEGLPKTPAKVRAVFKIPADAEAPIPSADPAPNIQALGVKGIVKKVVRFFKVKIDKTIKNIPDKIKSLLVNRVDKLINKRPGLKLVSAGMKLQKASDKQLKAMEGKEVLLFVHGIFSSITGAFDELAKGSSPPLDTWLNRYGNRVLGFDHYTASQSTLENAKDLISRIPKGCTLNIICHSRGAGVVRCLLEHASLQNARKNFKVNRVCFVAGACLGSALAEKHTVDRLFNVLALLFGKSIPTKLWARVAKILLHGIQDFPGVESMAESSNLIQTLNKSTSTHAQEYVYLRANYDPTFLPTRIADELVVDQLIFQGANDVIVPYDGAGVSQKYLNGAAVKKESALNLGSQTEPQHDVWHTNFFGDAQVQEVLLKQV